MKKLLLLLLFPVLSYSQGFVWMGTEIDPRNAIFGGTVNEQAFDGMLKLGYRNGHFEANAFYEIFPVIDYKSYGVNLNIVTRPEKLLVPVAGFQVSMIQRPWHLYPSLAINAKLEYHFNRWSRFFVYIRGESKLRSDWNDKIVHSGYFGVAYKFN